MSPGDPGSSRLGIAAATISSADSPSGPSRGTQLALLVIGLQFGLLYAPTVLWLFERWTMSVWHHAHGLLIPPVVLYFVSLELKRFKAAPAEASGWGFAFLAPALCVRALDAGMDTELLSAVSLLIAFPGLSLLTLGPTRTRAIAFPLAFLAFALPVPLAFTERIHWELREIATAGTAAVVPLFGIPIYAEGTTLDIGGVSLEVADACSGFSTLYASVAVAALVAYSGGSTRRRILVLLSAVPLAIFANLIRVIGLVLVVIESGPLILDTWVHPVSGIMTFCLALPVIFWLGTESRGKAGR